MRTASRARETRESTRLCTGEFRRGNEKTKKKTKTKKKRAKRAIRGSPVLDAARAAAAAAAARDRPSDRCSALDLGCTWVEIQLRMVKPPEWGLTPLFIYSFEFSGRYAARYDLYNAPTQFTCNLDTANQSSSESNSINIERPVWILIAKLLVGQSIVPLKSIEWGKVWTAKWTFFFLWSWFM